MSTFQLYLIGLALNLLFSYNVIKKDLKKREFLVKDCLPLIVLNSILVSSIYVLKPFSLPIYFLKLLIACGLAWLFGATKIWAEGDTLYFSSVSILTALQGWIWFMIVGIVMIISTIFWECMKVKKAPLTLPIWKSIFYLFLLNLLLNL